jgi:hypothetical protein
MKKRLMIGLAGLLFFQSLGWGQQPSLPLEEYRNLKYPPIAENFDKGWKERVALEFEIINAGDFKSLRAALKDENRFVRAMAVRALGILADKASGDAIAKLAKDDSEFIVRMRAVESLGLLKMHPAAIKLAKKERDGGVRWSAGLAAEEFKSKQDHARELQQAFAVGPKRSEMGVAEIGKPAPDFTARTIDGKPFKLSSVLGTKSIAIYFAAFDC